MNAQADRGLAIRRATCADAEVLARMVGELAEFERLSHSNAMTPEAMTTELSSVDPVLEAIIAELDGQAVGMATYFSTYSTFAAARGLYLEDLYVVPTSRHRGVGTALLRWVANRAVERGCGRLEWTTLLWNSDSIEFYERLGAKPNDAWTSYRLTGESLQALAGSDQA